jgi:hypothetical protein
LFWELLTFKFIIIGKTALFQPQPSLEGSDIASGFHLFGFRDNNFFTEKGRQPCVQPPTWRTMSRFSWPPGTGFSFRRRLRLERPLWRYSNPPPYLKHVHLLQCNLLCPHNKPKYKLMKCSLMFLLWGDCCCRFNFHGQGLSDLRSVNGTSVLS